MVKDYNVYRFEKILVGKISANTSERNWLDDVLQTQNLIPKNLTKATHGDYNVETGNFIIGDPSYAPEMPLCYLEEVHRPAWSLPENSTMKWLEDDATCSHQDHETVRMAYLRIFMKTMPEPIATWNAGDAIYNLLPAGRVVIESYPGNSQIRVLDRET